MRDTSGARFVVEEYAAVDVSLVGQKVTTTFPDGRRAFKVYSARKNSSKGDVGRNKSEVISSKFSREICCDY